MSLPWHVVVRDDIDGRWGEVEQRRGMSGSPLPGPGGVRRGPEAERTEPVCVLFPLHHPDRLVWLRDQLRPLIEDRRDRGFPLPATVAVRTPLPKPLSWPPHDLPCDSPIQGPVRVDRLAGGRPRGQDRRGRDERRTLIEEVAEIQTSHLHDVGRLAPGMTMQQHVAAVSGGETQTRDPVLMCGAPGRGAVIAHALDAFKPLTNLSERHETPSAADPTPRPRCRVPFPAVA